MSHFRLLRKYLMPVLILAIVLIVGCRGCRERDDSFPQAGIVPIAPSVTDTYPEAGNAGIPLNTKISVTFNMPMVESQLNTSTFSLSVIGGAPITGTVTYVGMIAIFTPTANLAANTSYTATISSGIRSDAGGSLAENFTWTFTTGATLDTTAPTVVSTNPVSGSIGVPVNTIVAVPFSEVMDPASINSLTFFMTEAPIASIRAQRFLSPSSVPGGLVTGTVSYLGQTAYFKPTTPLKLGTTYTAVITTGAKDVAGNPLAEDYIWSFTGVVADTTPPTVLSTDPAANKTGVAINTKIAVTFNELMSISTLTNLSFKVEGISGTVTYDPLTKIATFKPTVNLEPNKLYTATITTGAQDLAGNAITGNYNWSFTTGAAADTTAPTLLATVPLSDATNVPVSQHITSTFSEGMDVATINGTTISLKRPDGTAVTGTVTYAGTTATFIPTGELANATLYNVVVTTGVKDLAGNAMAAAKTWSFTTGVTATTVTSTDPLNAAVNVATNKSVSATFSGPMDPATINGTTFTLKGPGGAAVAGAVSYTGTTATFKPAAVLADSTLYTATITTGAKDAAGNPLAAAKVWSFTSGAAADTLAPSVISTTPAEGETGVLTNKSITAMFSESMDFATINNTTFTLTGAGGATVGGTVTYIGTTATFKPTVSLGNSTIYTATITTGARDAAGNALTVAKTWSFTTGVAADSVAPTVVSVDPADAATVVATNKTITANFSENMDSSTLTTTNFTLRELGGAFVDGAVSYAGTTAAFKPAIVLKDSTTYVANITVGVKDLAGNAMAAAKTWSFVTGAAPDTVAPTVASTDPLNGATGVVTNKSIIVSFSESMNSATLTIANFTLKNPAGALIDGTVTYDAASKAATFKPASILANSTTYVAEITTAVEDLAGNKIAAAKTWSFTTGVLADTIAPTVSSTSPAAGETGVSTNNSITAIFSEGMDSATITNTTFTLSGPGGAAVSGTVSYSGTTATFKPTNPLSNSAVYTARITTGVKDTAGNAISAEKAWSFTTGVAADSVAPTVISVDPAADATAVATNKIVTANFSENMDSATITGTTFTLSESGGALVAGTVAGEGTTATFRPTSLLKNSTTYVANISVGVKDLAGNAMAAARTWSFVTGAAPDTVAPTVTSTSPVNGDVNTPINSSITAVFSENMDSATITNTTFALSGPGGAAVSGTVSYSGTTATFKPTSSLSNSVLYTAIISTGVKDTAGNTMAAAKTWSFTTGVAADAVAPTITSVDPADAAVAVATNKIVTANFSENMDSSTISNSTFTVGESGGALIAGTVTYDGTTATFRPASLLKNSTSYVANVTVGVKDLAGNAMAVAKTWNFTTGAAPDTAAPTVTSTSPVDGEKDVLTTRSVTALFSESMDAATITNTTFTLSGPGGALIGGAVTYSGTTATFKPTNPLDNSAVYTAEITTGVKDAAGNAMAATKTWSFTTVKAPDTVAPSIVSVDPVDAATAVATNKIVMANFSESMDASTLTTTTFTLRESGGDLVAGTVSYSGTTAAFSPTSVLKNSTTYVANITVGVKDLAGNAMAAARTWSFVTGAAPDTIAPTVTSTSPVADETAVETNKSITALFSETMDAATITNTTFTLSGPGGAVVSGVVSYSGTTATFNPTNLLGNSSVYTARITTGVKDSAGNAMSANKTWSFTTGAAADLVAPTVISVDPVDGATAVATNKIVTANFSENIDASTINDTTFTVREFGGDLIPGSVTYAGTTASFDPTNLLKNSTTYVANLTVGVKDLAGNAMAAAKTWSFITGAAPDTVAPTVTVTSPLNEAIGVATNKSIIASFSESMNSATITNVSFTVRKLGGALIDGAVTYDSTAKAATFKPTNPLANLATYVAEITTAVEDLSGNAMAAAKTWSFATIAPADSVAPQVTVVYPANLAKDIGCKEAITATFDEDMDADTVLQTLPKVTFTVTGPGLTPVDGVVTYLNKVAKFVPDNDLPDNTTFTATIATQAKDLAGNELVNPKVWTFTTGQSVPVLGRASSFALMATTSIDGTTGSSINGDVGVSPSGRTSITLSPVEINGGIYSGTDAAIVNAITDLTVAYDTAKGKATNVVTVATKDLGGKTFFPGLYKTGDTFDITSGNLTLDAQGNENAVFIFQMPETLTVAVNRQVILINNAKADNIYWQVGSSATINGTAIFKGNIMANVSITVNNGCAIEGRLLAGAGTAGAGAVTFNSSTIVLPAP